MSKITNTVRFGGMIAVLMSAILLLSFIFGWINVDQLKTTFAKAISVVLVLVLTSLAITSIASSDK